MVDDIFFIPGYDIRGSVAAQVILLSESACVEIF